MTEERQEVILEARNLSYTYEEGEKPALQDVSLRIQKGRKVAFMGANGSGKSTFFLCCNGIFRPDRGEILFHGKPVDYSRKGLLGLRKNVGIVFQDPDHQLFSASVKQEISFGAFNIGMAEEEVRRAVDEVIGELEITPFQEKPTHALSGGQKKQVAIADILVMRPEIIILDEPAAALDPRHDRIVRRIVEKLTDEGITVLMATHNIDYAYEWADEVVLMHEGRILGCGTPAEIFSDRTALEKTNLREPVVLSMYECLRRNRILQDAQEPPGNLEELMRRIEERGKSEDGKQKRNFDR